MKSYDCLHLLSKEEYWLKIFTSFFHTSVRKAKVIIIYNFSCITYFLDASYQILLQDDIYLEFNF